MVWLICKELFSSTVVFVKKRSNTMIHRHPCLITELNYLLDTVSSHKLKLTFLDMYCIYCVFISRPCKVSKHFKNVRTAEEILPVKTPVNNNDLRVFSEFYGSLLFVCHPLQASGILKFGVLGT